MSQPGAVATRPLRSADHGSEVQLTFLLFLLSFFGLGLPRIFTSNTVHTIFIETYGPEFIPYAYIAQALLIPVFGHLYIKADERWPLRKLVIGSMVIDIVILLALWSGFSFTRLAPFAFAGMIWFEAEFVLCSLWLWGTATQLMHLRQGKRLFGYISAGEPTGIIFGGLATSFALQYVAIKELLLISVAGVCIAIGVVSYLTTHYRPQSESELESSEEISEQPKVRPWYKDKYVQVLIGVVIISQFGYFFTDTVFYLEASERYPIEQDLGGFLGKYMACVGIVSLILSLFVSGPLTRGFGLKGALLLLPVLLAVTSTVGLIAGLTLAQMTALFWIVFIMKTMDQSIRYTVDKTASVSLYQPLPATQRMQVQTALESIVEPIIGGISGLTLALMLHVFGLGTRGVVMAIIVISTVWISLVLVQDRHYRKALRRAIYARRLGVGQMSIEDPAAIAVITGELDSPVAGRVLNALGLVHSIEGFDLVDCYERLLAHPSDAVRHEVLHQIELLGAGGFDPERVREQAGRETDPKLRAAAFRTLSAVDPEHASSHLLPLLDADEEPVRLEAFVGLIRNGGEGVEHTRTPLLAALNSEDSGRRRFAAMVLERGRPDGFEEELTRLVQDPDPTVRCAALRALGPGDLNWFWPRVTKLLEDSDVEVSLATESALARFGNAALGQLTDLLLSAGAGPSARRSAARVLGMIGSHAARQCLLQSLVVPDRRVEEAVLFALNPGASPDSPELDAINAYQSRVVSRAEKLRTWKSALTARHPPEIEPVLQRALADQLELDVKSLFHLMGLVHPEVDTGDVWASYQSEDTARRAIAIELTETLLAPEVRSRILALLEHRGSNRKVTPRSAVTHPVAPDTGEVLRAVLSAPAALVTPWTRATALYTLLKTEGPGGDFPDHGTHDPVYAELVRSQDANTHEPSRYPKMLTIEKVLILRNTEIFHSVKEEHLVDVAERAQPLELEDGVTLFRRGETGNALFVVVEGRVKAHIDDLTLAELGPGEVVGEMAALDPQPRSASVTAIEPSLLLQLSNNNLQLLIDHNPTVARGIIKLLCVRLREAGVKSMNEGTGHPA